MKTLEHIDLIAHIRQRKLDALQKLLDDGADPNWSDGKPLLEAAAEDWIPGIEALLAAGAQVDVRDSLALTLATRNHHVDTAQRLIQAGADPLGGNGQAIATAIAERHEQLLALLVRAAQPQLGPRHHETLARLMNDALLAQFGVEVLLNAGAPYDMDRMYDTTCKVLQDGNAGLVERLLEAGLDPNHEPPATDIERSSNLLATACCRWTDPMDRIQIVRMLIEAGARDPEGEARRAAEATGDSQLISLVAKVAGEQD